MFEGTWGGVRPSLKSSKRRQTVWLLFRGFNEDSLSLFRYLKKKKEAGHT